MSDKIKSGLQIIAEERQRQIDEYGYTDTHIQSTPEDYENGELADAAASYALDILQREYEGNSAPVTFPWPDEYWKPTPFNRVKELAKAGAMIAAEINRLTGYKD